MRMDTSRRLALVLALGGAACSAAAPSSGTASDPASADPAASTSSGGSSGDGSSGSSGGASSGGTSGSSGASGDGGLLPDGASPGVTTRTSVRLDGSAGVCDAIATASGVYFSTPAELRAVVDAAAGTTRLVGTLPSSGCGSLAATASTLYMTRAKGATGELLSAPLAGGAVEVVGTIPALTPASANGRYPIVSDGSDVFIAASPNVWHLPATAGGALTRLMVGSYNYYATELAVAPGASTLYAYNGGSAGTISQFATAGGPYTSKNGVYGDNDTFVVAGGSLFTTVSYPTTADILRISLDFQGAPTPFARTAASALATDGASLYATTIAPTPQGSAVESLAVSAFSLASGAPLASFGTIVTAPGAPQVKSQARFSAPLVVDGAHVYVRETHGTLIAMPK